VGGAGVERGPAPDGFFNQSANKGVER